MVQIKCTQITYEALGRVQVTYSESLDMEYILNVIRSIADTARITNFKSVVIDKSIYKENNIAQIEDWYNRIKCSDE